MSRILLIRVDLKSLFIRFFMSIFIDVKINI